MDGAVVRALASYRCSPGLIPGPGVTSEARLLSDLVRGFFSRSSGFLPPRKPTFQFDLETVDKKTHLLKWPLLNPIFKIIKLRVPTQ